MASSAPQVVLKMLLTLLLMLPVTIGLENGLVRTPPMGWLAWQRFRCNTDCVNDPRNCISERLFYEMADRLVEDGYAAVGYEYINIDDCWMARSRDGRGRLQADPERFPHGIRALADYVHSRGLKLGIYEDYGNLTCAGYPGILGHLEQDARTFAEWGVDYVKIDGCHSLPEDMDKGYPEFGYHLNNTGRPMVYSCSWPVYQVFAGMKPDYGSIIRHCNLWRNYDDIQDSWTSVTDIVNYYGDNQQDLIPLAGPGHFNDPDMLIIGNFGLSFEQSRAQMALWSVMASPLLASVDLRTIDPKYRDILQNRGAIQVNQDPLGIQGKRVFKEKGIEMWTKPITPIVDGFYSFAVVFFNQRVDGTPSQVSVTLQELGMTSPAGYRTEDLFELLTLGLLFPDDTIQLDVNPSGIVMIQCIAVRPPPPRNNQLFRRSNLPSSTPSPRAGPVLRPPPSKSFVTSRPFQKAARSFPTRQPQQLRPVSTLRPVQNPPGAFGTRGLTTHAPIAPSPNPSSHPLQSPRNQLFGRSHSFFQVPTRSFQDQRSQFRRAGPADQPGQLGRSLPPPSFATSRSFRTSRPYQSIESPFQTLTTTARPF